MVSYCFKHKTHHRYV